MLRSSKSRLTDKQLSEFSGTTLFDEIARAVCRAGTLPAKELYEAWEVARRVRRVFRGGRVVDAAGGHGLLGHILLLLDDTSSEACVVDPRVPRNAGVLSWSIMSRWPRLTNRIHYIPLPIQDFEIKPGDIVVSVHACGSMTDEILHEASLARSRVAVLPCCHDHKVSDTGGLDGWMDGSLAIDATRAGNLRQRGYSVITRTIPRDITPKNRLLMGIPFEMSSGSCADNERMTASLF
ncbi:MAG: methyltransferase [Pseudomonadota bacterium]